MRSFLEFAAPRLRKSLESDEAKLATKPPKVAKPAAKAELKATPKKQRTAA
jgi:hypothetical protein